MACISLYGVGRLLLQKRSFYGSPLMAQRLLPADSSVTVQKEPSNQITSITTKCLLWPLNQLLKNSEHTMTKNRTELQIRDWADLLQKAAASSNGAVKDLIGAEIGVYEGEFAAQMLEQLDRRGLLKEYILVDPWRHLAEWNKPYNKQNDEFARIFALAMRRTKENPNFQDKVTVLRDMSYEASLQVPDKSLDFVYIDGDHTAKGAMKDLLLWTPKVKCGGLVFGDDYSDNTQHGEEFDPTMVKSAVKAYVEANNLDLHEVGANQFAFVMK